VINDGIAIMDIMTPEKRSVLMGRIRGRDTEPEKKIRQLLHSLGYRFRTHAADLPGHPDIVFRSRRIAIFVHGCFWHRHDCGLAYMPKTRREFWQLKFDRNVERDVEVQEQLRRKGWRVIVVWECQLKHPSRLASLLMRLLGPTRMAQS
jgi:DNA mismatch endonuclease (patch repair protein)